MDPFDFDDLSPSAPRQRSAAARPGRWTLVLLALGAVLVMAAGAGVYFVSQGRPVPATPSTAIAPASNTPPPQGVERPDRRAVEPRELPPPAPPEVDRPRQEVEARREAALTRIPDGLSAADLSEVDPKYLPSPFVEPKKDPKTGFVVGGRNETAVIRTLTELNGRPIAELEADMRPDNPNTAAHRSSAGFLTNDQRLLDVLAADNDYVLHTLGLTHQDLARPLKAAFAAGRWLRDFGPDGIPRPRDTWRDFYMQMRAGEGPAVVAANALRQAV